MKLTRFEFIVGSISLLCRCPLPWGGNLIYRGYKIEPVNDFIRAIPVWREEAQMGPGFGPLWKRPYLYADQPITQAPGYLKSMIDTVIAENRALTVTEWNDVFKRKLGFHW